MAGGRLTPALAARQISKSFGAQRALDDVGITVDAGEVHGLIGENGSGKSTLIRILAGYHAPAEGGRLEVAGRPVGLPLRPGEFRNLGMSFVHQDLGLIPSLSVVENLWLDELSTEWRLRLSWRRERGRARDGLARLGIDLDPRAAVRDLRPAEQAMLAVARAVEGLPEAGGLLVLDEPTAFLPDAERRRVGELVRKVAAGGAGVLFVSHDLGEVREATERITVLRDGRTVASAPTGSLGARELFELMVGHPAGEAEPRGEAAGDGSRRVSIVGVEGAVARGVSLDLRAGEILGLTGLAGSGFEEVPYLMFGALPCRGGRLVIDEVELDLAELRPERAIGAGLALLPADHARHGSVGSLSVADNLTLPALDRYRTRFGLARRRMREDASRLMADHDVRPRRPSLAYRAFSGGNQQKAQLAKWLAMRPACLLLDEPTRGLDVRAREQLIAMIRRVAGEGTAVLCATNDHEQLSALCDRVLVFSRGRVTNELGGDELTKEGIARACHRAALELKPARG